VKSPVILKQVEVPSVPSRPSTSLIIPQEIKNEFLSIFNESGEDFGERNDQVLAWLEEKVVELVEAKIGKMDEAVRERVAKEKVEMEGRLRSQIEQELQHEMTEAKKRQDEAQQRCIAREEELNKKIKEVEEERRAAVRFAFDHIKPCQLPLSATL